MIDIGPDGTGTRPERVLAAVEAAIRGMLGRPIGPEENFFEAGLTSLTLVRLHEVAARELRATLPATALFAHPNLRMLRRYLRGGAGDVPVPAGRPPDGDRLRRIGGARRELRQRNRSASGSRS